MSKPSAPRAPAPSGPRLAPAPPHPFRAPTSAAAPAAAAAPRPPPPQLCKPCFFAVLEDEVHGTITANRLFARGERVAIAASGGKDSTVLAHMLTLLNERHDYGLDLFLLSIDEGITGYRDDSLDTVRRNEATYGIPLTVLSYRELYGWSMDEIVAAIGTRNNCTFCGVFRRQALDRGGLLERADKVATGHNADDLAETILLNIIRGDVPRLSRCAAAVTGEGGPLPRVKPFKYTYEKEIVMYAHFKCLDYFSTECVYAPFAARGFARDFVKDLEAARPSAIMDLIHSAESWALGAGAQQAMPAPQSCERCGFMTSQPVCKACILLEGLNRGLPSLGVARSRGRAAAKARAAAAQGQEQGQQQQQEQQGQQQQEQQQQEHPGGGAARRRREPVQLRMEAERPAAEDAAGGGLQAAAAGAGPPAAGGGAS
ncbi:NCS6 [Scenedesmus sp. PABB004]|nr:NCS6 [Scenedesmus sp. PABB004]